MLLTVKLIGIFLIIAASSYVGILISKKYTSRINELQELILSLEMFETRLNYTYDTIPDAFLSISKHLKTNVKNIFENTALRLNKTHEMSAGDTFLATIDEEKILLNLKNEDIETIKGLSLSLGQVDAENQTKNIRLVLHTLKSQLENANIEKTKNYKLYKNIGVLAGLTVAIFLI